jgi:hypothetical protein
MALRPFRKIPTSSEDLNKIQDSIKETVDALVRNPVLAGHLIGPVTLATGPNTVGHGLGRRALGVWQCLPTAASSLSLAASADPNNYLTVVASAPCQATLYVF